MLGPLSADRADKFRFSVEEIFKPKDLSFPVNLFLIKQVNSIFFLTAAYKVTVGVLTWIFKISQDHGDIRLLRPTI